MLLKSCMALIASAFATCAFSQTTEVAVSVTDIARVVPNQRGAYEFDGGGGLQTMFAQTAPRFSVVEFYEDQSIWDELELSEEQRVDIAKTVKRWRTAF